MESSTTEVRETTRFPPVGHCIYCPSSSGLSDEHIIPYGLGGNLVLPESSCPDCKDITSKIETKVLRGFMLTARAVASFPTRHPRKRPNHFELEVQREGENFILSLEASEFPALLPLPRFPPAGYLTGKTASEGLSVCGNDTIQFGRSPLDVLRRLATKLIRLRIDVDAYAFAQMIAKIGYAYFVGINGPVRLSEVPVLPFIRGERADGDLWVGSGTFQMQSERKGALHSLALIRPTLPTQKIVVHVARVKLFAASGAGGYEVVTHVSSQNQATGSSLPA